MVTHGADVPPLPSEVGSPVGPSEAPVPVLVAEAGSDEPVPSSVVGSDCSCLLVGLDGKDVREAEAVAEL